MLNSPELSQRAALDAGSEPEPEPEPEPDRESATETNLTEKADTADAEMDVDGKKEADNDTDTGKDASPVPEESNVDIARRLGFNTGLDEDEGNSVPEYSSSFKITEHPGNSPTMGNDDCFAPPIISRGGTPPPVVTENHFPSPPRCGSYPYALGSAETPTPDGEPTHNVNAFAVRSWSGKKNFDDKRFLLDSETENDGDDDIIDYPFNYDEVVNGSEDEEADSAAFVAVPSFSGDQPFNPSFDDAEDAVSDDDDDVDDIYYEDGDYEDEENKLSDGESDAFGLLNTGYDKFDDNQSKRSCNSNGNNNINDDGDDGSSSSNSNNNNNNSNSSRSPPTKSHSIIMGIPNQKKKVVSRKKMPKKIRAHSDNEESENDDLRNADDKKIEERHKTWLASLAKQKRLQRENEEEARTVQEQRRLKKKQALIKKVIQRRGETNYSATTKLSQSKKVVKQFKREISEEERKRLDKEKVSVH